MIKTGRKKESVDCKDKQTNEETFHCLQTEATDDIQKTQSVLTENQGAIKQTLDVMNGSLNRIYQLYKKQEERLDNGDKRFQEIRDFIVKKDASNGHIEKEIEDNTQDIKKGHDNRLGIEVRVTTLEVCYTNLLKSNETIINLLKTIGIGLIIAFVTFMFSILTHIIHL